MKLIDVAKEFAGLNVFNDFTESTIISRAKVFSNRTGVENIDEITLHTIALFKQKTLKIAKPITYNGYLRYLRIIGDYAVSLGLMDRNVFRDVKLAPVGFHPSKIMTETEIHQIHKHIIANQEVHRPYWFWLTVIYCFYYTGMRRRQLVNLKLSDIDFQKGTILLRYQGSKTRREWRIPLHTELSEHLKVLIDRTERTLFRTLNKDDFIFDASRFYPRYARNRDGGMRADAITGYFKRLTGSSGISVGAHRFRHTFATALCNPTDNSTPDIFAAQSILGHTSLQTTRGYVQTNMGRMEDALKKIGAPFSNKLTSGSIFQYRNESELVVKTHITACS
jgi:integrase